MSVPAGAPVLDERERAALTAIAIGLTTVAAAHRMGISDRTVRRAVAAAAAKLGAADRTHAVALAALTGQLDPRRIRSRTLPAWPPGRGNRQPRANLNATRSARSAPATAPADVEHRFLAAPGRPEGT
ncbi:LuxR C-terminal-related transcriptional regulator [Actinomadura nitritigenes]|uniref:LuxR C-terminal-related transcriptional regulator n=1 Tax=Actinomadura nitritigenes TaxID=134602 RepID=UPI003D8C77C8